MRAHSSSEISGSASILSALAVFPYLFLTSEALSSSAEPPSASSGVCAPTAAGSEYTTSRRAKRPAPRQRTSTPSSFSESPEKRRPAAKNFLRASSCMSGWVKRNTRMTSMMAVRPRVKAKPRTFPTATR